MAATPGSTPNLHMDFLGRLMVNVEVAQMPHGWKGRIASFFGHENAQLPCDMMASKETTLEIHRKWISVKRLLLSQKGSVQDGQ